MTSKWATRSWLSTSQLYKKADRIILVVTVTRTWPICTHIINYKWNCWIIELLSCTWHIDRVTGWTNPSYRKWLGNPTKPCLCAAQVVFLVGPLMFLKLFRSHRRQDRLGTRSGRVHLKDDEILEAENGLENRRRNGRNGTWRVQRVFLLQKSQRNTTVGM